MLSFDQEVECCAEENLLHCYHSVWETYHCGCNYLNQLYGWVTVWTSSMGEWSDCVNQLYGWVTVWTSSMGEWLCVCVFAVHTLYLQISGSFSVYELCTGNVVWVVTRDLQIFTFHTWQLIGTNVLPSHFRICLCVTVVSWCEPGTGCVCQLVAALSRLPLSVIETSYCVVV